MGELSTDEKTVYQALLHPGEVTMDSWVSALTRMKAERTRLEREYGIALDLLRQILRRGGRKVRRSLARGTAASGRGAARRKGRDRGCPGAPVVGALARQASLPEVGRQSYGPCPCSLPSSV